VTDVNELLRFAENPDPAIRPSAYLTSCEGELEASVIWPVRISGRSYEEVWHADFGPEGSIDAFKVLYDGQSGREMVGLEVHELTLFAGVAMRDVGPTSVYTQRLSGYVRARLNEDQ